MVQITIDTEKESKETVRNIIRLLEQTIGDKHVVTNFENNSLDTFNEPQASPFDMFGSQPSQEQKPAHTDVFASQPVQEQKTAHMDMFAPKEQTSPSLQEQTSNPLQEQNDMFSTFSNSLPSSSPSTYDNTEKSSAQDLLNDAEDENDNEENPFVDIRTY